MEDCEQGFSVTCQLPATLQIRKSSFLALVMPYKYCRGSHIIRKHWSKDGKDSSVKFNYFVRGTKQTLDFIQRTEYLISYKRLNVCRQCTWYENLVSVATSLYIWRLIATAIAFQVSLNTTASMLLASSFTLSSRPTRARSSCGDTTSSLQHSESSSSSSVSESSSASASVSVAVAVLVSA